VIALPLTAAQRGIWFAQQRDPRSPAFVTADCVRASPTIDAQRLAHAVGAALREAEGLHARFGEEDDGAPWQLLGAAQIDVPVIDIDGADAAHAWMGRDLRTTFDLAAGGLTRQAVLRVARTGVWWYQAIHHLATDAYGTSLLLRRAAEHYRSAAPAPPRFRALSELLELDAAYAGSAAHAADAAYWRHVLAGLDGAAGPAGRRTRADGAPRRVEVAVPGGGAPAAPVALARVALWLSRTIGTDDVVLGLPWMGRLGSAAARAPACWVNVLPLRLVVTPARSMARLISDMGAALKAAGRHARYRYEEMLRDTGMLDGERRLVGPMVNLKPFLRELELGGERAEVRNLAAGPVEDMTLTLTGPTLVAEGHPELYDSETLMAHAERLALVIGGREDTMTPSGRVVTVRPVDRQAELRAARGRDVAVPDGTLWSGFAAQAGRTPDAPAVVFGSATLCYRELHARARALATVLAGRGARPGAVVGVRMARSAELLVALLAVLRTGAAYLPLELDLPSARRAEMESDARPVCVIDTATVDGPAGDLGAAPAPDDLAYVIYTSGSTGRPKGVAVAHRAIVNRLAWMQDAFALAAGERVLLKTPLGFDVSVWELFWALQVGATLVVAPPGAHRDPEALAAELRAQRISTTHFVPSMLQAFLAAPAAASCVDLRRIICSGEALGQELAQRCLRTLPGAQLHNLYGPTEAAVDVTAHEVRAGHVGPVPIGAPVWNTRAYVLDAALQPCAPGTTGELHLAGVQLAAGYRGRTALTAERFVADPYGEPGTRMYRTGDLVRRRADGALEYHGRSDQQVKVRGVRIEPGEVEAVLLRHPAVAQAAVVAREDGPGDVRLVAYVVVDPRVPAEPAALRAHAAAWLPDAMVPAAVVLLQALPVGPSGKLDRRALPAPDIATGSGRAPRDWVQERLCALFAAELRVGRVGADESLFDLGGHSLLAAALTARIRAELGVEITVGSVFAAPTPAALAARINAGANDAREALLRLRGGTGPALFCVHPAGGLGWCYAPLAARLPPGIPVHCLQADGTDDPTLDALAARYVARVRAAQPSGPYHVAGWSVGGVIAHTMATQLQEAGCEVGALVLLDAYPGEQWRGLPAPDEQEALRALLRMGGLDAAEGTAPTLEDVLERLRDAGSALASLSSGALAAVAATVVLTAGLMRRAEHRVYRGELTFFTAAAPRAETWIDRAGWHAHLDGPLHNVDLPCTHPELVHPRYAGRIAAATGALMVRETVGA
jgi:enterobactin synthetase component F